MAAKIDSNEQAEWVHVVQLTEVDPSSDQLKEVAVADVAVGELDRLLDSLAGAAESPSDPIRWVYSPGADATEEEHRKVTQELRAMYSNKVAWESATTRISKLLGIGYLPPLSQQWWIEVWAWVSEHFLDAGWKDYSRLRRLQPSALTALIEVCFRRHYPERWNQIAERRRPATTEPAKAEQLFFPTNEPAGLEDRRQYRKAAVAAWKAAWKFKFGRLTDDSLAQRSKPSYWNERTPVTRFKLCSGNPQDDALIWRVLIQRPDQQL